MSAQGVLRGFLKSLVFGIGILILVEMTFRVFVYGSDSLNIYKMNSMTHIWNSGLVQPSEYPGIYYELKPYQEALFRTAPFSTNSIGLADQEYSLAKPANTFRAVVVGSSWSMPSGVAAESAYHSVLEKELNESASGLRYEFINFAVENYGLQEMVATLEHRALPFDPDLILFSLTPYTPRVRFMDDPERFVEREREYPALRLHSLRWINLRLELGWFEVSDHRRPTVSSMEESSEQLSEALFELGQLTGEPQIPVVIVWLGWWPPFAPARTVLSRSAEEFGYVVVDATERLRRIKTEGQIDWNKLEGGRWDKHPSWFSHQIIAEDLKQALLRNGLIPVR